MDLSARQYAFLKHEMSSIRDDTGRHSEDRHLAAEIFEKIEAELKGEADQNPSGEETR